MNNQDCCAKDYSQLVSHHQYLLLTSHACLISAIYGIIHNSSLWVIPAGVYVNSINYWRHPVNGFRRNLDMCWGILGLVISVSTSGCSTNAIPYRIMTFSACLMYPLSYYFYWKKQYIIATFIHSMIHIFGNIGNIYLFTGGTIC
jgi:hypothetical protein